MTFEFPEDPPLSVKSPSLIADRNDPSEPMEMEDIFRVPIDGHLITVYAGWGRGFTEGRI